MLRIVLVVMAGLLAVPAAVLAQSSPTLALDAPCYSPGDTMELSGTGFTPNGAVDLLLSSPGNPRTASMATTADAGGALSARTTTPDPDAFLDADQFRRQMAITATDRARAEAGAPPEQQFGAVLFTLSRWEVDTKTRGRGLLVTAVGFTHARGESLYVHYRRGGRTVKSVALGNLRGECGDLRKTLPRAFPRNAKPGSYDLVFNTSATNPRNAPRITKTLRLRRS
jgi:hypothetical protein